MAHQTPQHPGKPQAKSPQQAQPIKQQAGSQAGKRDQMKSGASDRDQKQAKGYDKPRN